MHKMHCSRNFMRKGLSNLETSILVELGIQHGRRKIKLLLKISKRLMIASLEITYSFSCNIPQPFKCPDKNACLGTVHGACHENYTGLLCELCRKEYYRHFKLFVRCPKRWVKCVQRKLDIASSRYHICKEKQVKI